MNKILINGLLFGALAGSSQLSSAALTGSDTVTVNFPATIMTQAAYGFGANQVPDAGGACPQSTGSPCYYEDGFVLGSPTDASGTNHIHSAGGITGGGLADAALAYHADSSGIYLRTLDGSAFDLKSLVFEAPIYLQNRIYGEGGLAENPFGLSASPNDIHLLGAQERWEIFGFSNAVNPDITTTDGYDTAVAHASIANGFSGTVGTDGLSDFLLDDAFKGVSAVWIHYFGYPSSPGNAGSAGGEPTEGGIIFGVTVDNIVLGAPAQVPVPAAAWLFGSGLLGLLSFGRKKQVLSA